MEKETRCLSLPNNTVRDDRYDPRPRPCDGLTLVPDYSVFANSDFDPNEYANAILAGEPYPPSAELNPKTPAKSTFEPSPKEDISVAIAKLNFGVEDVSKQIKSVVSDALIHSL